MIFSHLLETGEGASPTAKKPMWLSRIRKIVTNPHAAPRPFFRKIRGHDSSRGRGLVRVRAVRFTWPDGFAGFPARANMPDFHAAFARSIRSRQSGSIPGGCRRTGTVGSDVRSIPTQPTCSFTAPRTLPPRSWAWLPVLTRLRAYHHRSDSSLGLPKVAVVGRDDRTMGVILLASFPTHLIRSNLRNCGSAAASAAPQQPPGVAVVAPRHVARPGHEPVSPSCFSARRNV